jgi:hypothetical protein
MMILINSLRFKIKMWKEGLEFFVAVSDIADKSQMRAVLLHLAGEEEGEE